MDHGMAASISLTWMKLKSGAGFLVAWCEECRLVRERFISAGKDMASLAYIAAADALCDAGCWHARAAKRAATATTLPDVTDLPARQVERPRATSRPPRREPLPFAHEEVVSPSADPRREL
jgi:hypothetical protein